MQAAQEPGIRSAPEPSQQRIRASVIVPTYNSADTLAICLDALTTQDFPRDDYEIIIVDDGSSDNTADVVNRYSRLTPPVSYVKQPNQGPASARNLGARRARGDLLVFTDADCAPERNWLTEMCRPFAESHGQVSAVKGAYRTRQKSVIAKFAQLEFESRYRKLQESQYVDMIDTYSAAFKRDVFLSFGGFDTRFPVANNEDVEFSYRMAAQGIKMVFNPNAIVYHRHPDTLFRYLKVKFGRAYWRMVVYRSFPDKMKSDSYTPQTLKIQICLTALFLVCLMAGVFEPRYFIWLIPLTGLFLLTILPFLVVIVDIPLLTRTVHWFRQHLTSSVLAAWLKRLADLWTRSFLHRGAVAIGRTLSCAGRSIIGLLRRILRWVPYAQLAKAIHAAGKILVAGIALTFILIWRLICLPILIVSLVGRAFRSSWHWLRGLSFVKAISSGLNWLACTRVFMIPIAAVLLFLRGGVMAAGVLWGLQAQRSSRGRFSQILLLLISDVVGIVLACVAAYYSRLYVLSFGPGDPQLSIGPEWEYVPVVAVIFLSAFFLADLYKPLRGISQVNEFVLLTKTVILVGIALAILNYLAGVRHTRMVLLLTCFYTFVFVNLLRSVSRRVLGRWASREAKANTMRILIVGTGEVARLICRRLQNDVTIEGNVIGFATPTREQVGSVLDDVEVLGTFDELPELIDRYRIQVIFVSAAMLPQGEVLDLVDRLSSKPGVHVHVVSNLFDLIAAEIDIAEHVNIPITYLRNEQTQLLYLFAKRVMDVIAALLVVVLAFPFWLFIMLAIRMETDGPALFKQDRVGKDGRLFKIFKFRTMYIHTPEFALSPSSPKDQRITKIGRFLRKTSLDEFPQFINVLRGEMSLVGPRPEMPFIVDKYRDWERRRLQVKPGLTGLWQILGRKELPLHESIEFDFYYIKNRSFLLDLTILLKTIPVVLKGKGAY